MTDKIILTGATGFFGRHTLPVLEEHYGTDNVVGLGSADYDLTDPVAVERMFAENNPDIIVHYAAYSGGIGANRQFPGDFYYRNTLLTALMFDAAVRHGVKKLLYPMGGCSYPAKAVSPISEDQLWQGYPLEESACYSTAKMMGLVAARSYHQQHGLNASVIIPGNLYGEYDNFHSEFGHVVPGTVRRYHEAKINGVEQIKMWGTGKPQRDFVYAGDVAQLIPFFIDSYNEIGPVNISTGKTVSIRELAETAADLTDFGGDIHWDAEKPDGQMVKIFATDRLKALGLSCETSLKEGLKKTIDWFAKNYVNKGDGLRL